MDKIQEILNRGVANIIPNKAELEKILRSDKKLNIYLGIDPTATKIHLGHAVPLRKLQAFAELGHNVIFLIGDFTALIGDTSDKDSERPSLTPEQIEQNFKDYKRQAEKILDFSKIQIKHNSEWLEKLTFAEIIKLTQHFSFGDFASRELIKKRLTDGKHVGLHEALYPVMQGYDSYHMDTDIQIGGTDQTFNMQAGRTLQKDLRSKESFVLANAFLTGTDGRKMSKSWGNAIWLDDAPEEMYGKVMSIKDDLIIEYFTLATNVSLSEIEKIKQELTGGANPIELKKRLAYEIVKELNLEQDASGAQKMFENTVQKGELPEEIVEVKFAFETPLLEIALKEGLVESTSEWKRLVEQGGVKYNSEKVSNANSVASETNSVLQIGKRKFVKIVTN